MATKTKITTEKTKKLPVKLAVPVPQPLHKICTAAAALKSDRKREFLLEQARELGFRLVPAESFCTESLVLRTLQKHEIPVYKTNEVIDHLNREVKKKNSSRHRTTYSWTWTRLALYTERIPVKKMRNICTVIEALQSSFLSDEWINIVIGAIHKDYIPTKGDPFAGIKIGRKKRDVIVFDHWNEPGWSLIKKS